MKKQFYRVKQLADQTFNKAEKSDLLNFEELQEADKNVEYLQDSLSSFVKKIQTGPNMDMDKRMKKTFEWGLYTLYNKNHKLPDDIRLFPDVFRTFSEIQRNLAKEHADHEGKVEEMVGFPLQSIVEQDFTNISKHKKTLSRYILDRDSASNRYQVTKKDAIKEDMEEADNKVDHTRDNLAVEMFNILSRENEVSSYMLQYLKLQQAYYASALECLKNNIPDLEKKIGNSKIKKIFGTPLEDHLRIYDTSIALPLEICVRALGNESCMNEEGLFRLAGSVLKVKRLKGALDSGCFKGLIPEYRDVHLLASIVKTYLRELPEPLMTYELYNEWMQVTKYSENEKVAAIKKIVDKLPHGNRINLAYFIQFLAKLVTYHKTNKMNPTNLATVVGPSLLWDRNEKDALNMANCATVNMVIETLIKEVHVFFPDDLSQHQSFPNLYIEEEKVIRHIHNENSTSTESINNNMESRSPKPVTRGLKKRAPGPPSRTDQDLINERSPMGASYPSGSSTLHRPQKIKSSVGVNTDENSFTRERHLASSNFINHETKATNLNLVKDNEAAARRKGDDLINFEEPHKIVTQPATQVQISKAKPVEQVERLENEMIVTKAVYQIGQAHHNSSSKPPNLPIAAPRSHAVENSGKPCVMSKSDSEGITLRKGDSSDRPGKPEVPVRPASLSNRRQSDESTLKAHVQISSVANKQQPSLVNLQNAEQFQPGHDNQISRKEQFLHQHDSRVVPAPRLSLKQNFNDNSYKDTSLPPRPDHLPLHFKDNHNIGLVSKSIEKLNDASDTTNGNNKPSHIRTKSDGNIVDFSDSPTSLLKTPPSPRNLNKPTQPPPPPPVVHKVKSACDSTDL